MKRTDGRQTQRHNMKRKKDKLVTKQNQQPPGVGGRGWRLIEQGVNITSIQKCFLINSVQRTTLTDGTLHYASYKVKSGGKTRAGADVMCF